MATNKQTYRTLKAMSDKLFSDPERVKVALKLAVKKARREKLIRQQLNELCDGYNNNKQTNNHE